MRSVRRRTQHCQAPPLRSIRRLAAAVAAGDLSGLPRNSQGQGLAWLAVGLEPETYLSPMVVECLKRVAEKPAKEKPEVKLAEKPEVKPAEKPEVRPAEKPEEAGGREA